MWIFSKIQSNCIIPLFSNTESSFASIDLSMIYQSIDYRSIDDLWSLDDLSIYRWSIDPSFDLPIIYRSIDDQSIYRWSIHLSMIYDLSMIFWSFDLSIDDLSIYRWSIDLSFDLSMIHRSIDDQSIYRWSIDLSMFYRWSIDQLMIYR